MRRIPFDPERKQYGPGDWLFVDEEGSCDALHPREETPRFHRYRDPVLLENAPTFGARAGWQEPITTLRAIRCPRSLSTEQWRSLQGFDSAETIDSK